LWIAIALVSGLASLAGYTLFQHSSPDVVAFVLAFAAGAILTMLANTMMPEAYDDGGKWVGVVRASRGLRRSPRPSSIDWSRTGSRSRWVGSRICCSVAGTDSQRSGW
jgi:hypothetical protein